MEKALVKAAGMPPPASGCRLIRSSVVSRHEPGNPAAVGHPLVPLPDPAQRRSQGPWRSARRPDERAVAMSLGRAAGQRQDQQVRQALPPSGWSRRHSQHRQQSGVARWRTWPQAGLLRPLSLHFLQF